MKSESKHIFKSWDYSAFILYRYVQNDPKQTQKGRKFIAIAVNILFIFDFPVNKTKQ